MKTNIISSVLSLYITAAAAADFIVVDTGSIDMNISSAPTVDCFPYLGAVNSLAVFELTHLPGNTREFTRTVGSLIFDNSPILNLLLPDTIGNRIHIDAEGDLSGVVYGIRFNDPGGTELRANFFPNNQVFVDATHNGCRFGRTGSVPYEKRVFRSGDSNLDGIFNSADLVTVFIAAKYVTGEIAHWMEGDWNGDGLFDTNDLVIAFQDGDYSNATTPLPEPKAIVLLAIGLLSITQHARRNTFFD